MFNVFKFEFLTAIKKKAFIISIVIMLILLAGVIIVPRLLEGTNLSGVFSGEEKNVGLYTTDSFFTEDLLTETLGQKVVKYETLEELEKEVKDEKLEYGIVYTDDAHEILKKNVSLDSSIDSGVNAGLEKIIKMEKMQALGLSEDASKELLNLSADFTLRPLQVDARKNFAIAYVNLMVLYILILTFGQQVAVNVAREKNDRTMELLITSTSPKNLIWGKVLAFGLLGMIYVVILYGGVFLATRYFANDMISAVVQAINFTMSIEQLVMVLLYFVLGYGLYLFLFAAAGSMISKMEDVGYAVQPIVLIFVAGFIATMTGLNGNVFILKIFSYIPLFSPLTMPVRYVIETVPTFEIIISLGILALSVIIIALLCTKLYRQGSLNYGSRPKFMKQILGVFKKN